MIFYALKPLVMVLVFLGVSCDRNNADSGAVPVQPPEGLASLEPARALAEPAAIACAGSGLTCDSMTSKKFEVRAQKAIRDIYAVLGGVVGGCDRNRFTESGPCRQENLRFVAKDEGSPSSKGQRVLILDFGFTALGMLRYAPRVLDIVEYAGQTGSLDTTQRVLKTTAGTKEVIHDIIGDKYSDLPAILFAPVSRRNGRNPGDLSKVGSTPRFVGDSEFAPVGGHGVIIFNKIADYNPHAEFVLFDLSNQSSAQEQAGIDFCKADFDARHLKKYERFVKNTFDSVAALIEKYEINFISSSVSTWKDLWTIQLKSACKRDLPNHVVDQIFRIEYNLFFKRLSEIEDVAIVQAVNNAVNFYDPAERQRHPMACTPKANQLRVGVFGILDSGIPGEGTDDVSKVVPSDKRSAIPCTDIMVNVGTAEGDDYEPASVVRDDCEQRPCTHWDNTLGIGLVGRLNAMDFSNSNSVAVALSYLIYLKNTLPNETTVPELIQCATGHGKKFIKDPIRHRQIEVYRLGHLDY